MAIHVISNQKVDFTDEEWNLYQKIVKSYTTPSCQGEQLFNDLFRSNDNGIITFLIPPSKKHTSLEIFLFLVSLQQQQFLRLAFEEYTDMAVQIKEKMAEIDEKLKELTDKKK